MPRLVARSVEEWGFQSVHAAIAPSEACKRAWNQRLNGRGRSMRVINYGTPMPPAASPAAASAKRAELGFEERDKLVAIIGSLYVVKGHDYLLQAMKTCVRGVPEAHLLIVGDGELRRDLEARTDSLGIREHVHFLGFRSDVAEIVNAMNVIALSSVWENFPLCLMEALAAGRPVVATTVGGIPEMIPHAECGLLVPPRQPAAMAEALISLLCDPRAAQSMGRAGRKRAESLYAEEIMARRTFDVYAELLRQSGTGASD